MTTLLEKLERAMALDLPQLHYIGDRATDEAVYMRKGRALESARRAPLDKLLLECVGALSEISAWWDVSDLSCVQPKRDPGAEEWRPRNDSMAAGAIHKAVRALAKLEAYVEGKDGN